MKFCAFTTILAFFTWFCSIDAETVCSNGFTLVNKKCWALVRQSKTHDDAANMCRFTDGAVLVQPQTEEENKLLVKFMADTGIDTVWMGIHCFGDNTKDCQWIDGSNPNDYGYSNFRNGAKDGYNYMFSSNTGQWVQANDGTKRFVCELPPTTKDCNSNCGVNYNNYCYKLYDMQKNFAEAQSYCQQRNSNLVSLHSWLEERMVAQLYRDEGKYWLGGKMDKKTKDITWLDGTDENGSPEKQYVSGNCLKIGVDSDGDENNWYGEDCSDLSIFICKRHALC